MIELATTIAVIAILAILLTPVFAKMKLRAQRVSCTANLRSLHMAVAQYIQDHDSWPQISADSQSEADYTNNWMRAMSPYGITGKTWVCPTIQERFGNPSLTNNEEPRRDYGTGFFPTGRMSPYKWSTQPWFFELGNAHGAGNLIIFPDGNVRSLNEI